MAFLSRARLSVCLFSSFSISRRAPQSYPLPPDTSCGQACHPSYGYPVRTTPVLPRGTVLVCRTDACTMCTALLRSLPSALPSQWFMRPALVRRWPRLLAHPPKGKFGGAARKCTASHVWLFTRTPVARKRTPLRVSSHTPPKGSSAVWPESAPRHMFLAHPLKGEPGGAARRRTASRVFPA